MNIYLEFVLSLLPGRRFEGVTGEAEELPDLLLSSLKSSLEELRASVPV